MGSFRSKHRSILDPVRSKRQAVQCSAQLSIGFYGAEVADVVADVPKSDDPTTFFWQTLAVKKEL